MSVGNVTAGVVNLTALAAAVGAAASGHAVWAVALGLVTVGMIQLERFGSSFTDRIGAGGAHAVRWWPVTGAVIAAAAYGLTRVAGRAFLPSSAIVGSALVIAAARTAPRPSALHLEVAARITVALAMVAGVTGGVWWWREREMSTAPPPVGVRGVNPMDSAALRAQADVAETSREMAEITSNDPYTTFTGASLLDHRGRFVNVTNRVRASYEPALSPGADPVDVWFFGASTMFGFGVQRDQHTIPSEFARLAEKAGIPVRVRNYGTTGVTNYSETILLSLLTTAGERPDLVVFYDGTNDVSLQLLDLFGGTGHPGEPGELGGFWIRDVVAAAKDVTPRAPTRVVARTDTGPPNAARLVDDIVSAYDQGVELSRALSERYGFEVDHFWQPDIFSKSPLDPGERSLLPSLALDPFQLETMQALSRRVRAKLPAGVTDLSDVFDHVDGPVLSDLVHTNELGAHVVAEAMFDELRGRLTAVTGAR